MNFEILKKFHQFHYYLLTFISVFGLAYSKEKRTIGVVDYENAVLFTYARLQLARLQRVTSRLIEAAKYINSVKLRLIGPGSMERSVNFRVKVKRTM